MSNLVNHPNKNDKQEVKNIYNSLPPKLVESFGTRALKDAKKIVENSFQEISEETLQDITFAIYRAYILGAVLERSNKDDIQFKEQIHETDENYETKRKLKQTSIPNVIKLVVD